ncbi:MAG: MAPEG family protein [Gammaproteobacteria bacterium]|nr:MAPEG family protein [Gammaproteobacteria bacterium]
MPANVIALAGAALALVLLTFAVGCRMLFCRIREFRARRLHPQAVATSLQMAAQMQDVQAADNFRNLFEVPVLFYSLVAAAIGTGVVPPWLVIGAWLFVALRVVHSAIQCTYNKVMHRFRAYIAGFLVIVVLWIGFVFSLVGVGD